MSITKDYMTGIYEPVARMSQDMAKAAMLIPHKEAKYLVRTYYDLQRNRIRADNQIKALHQDTVPATVTTYVSNQFAVLEDQLKRALDKYTRGNAVGAWMRSNFGVGPVLSAGFLAHIDIEKAPAAGNIWSYAGLNPEQVWLPGQLRPWNAELKKICWLQGQVFMKFSKNEKCYYGQLYRQKKEYYMFHNERGAYQEQAARELATKNYRDPASARKEVEQEDHDNDYMDGSMDMVQGEAFSPTESGKPLVRLKATDQIVQEDEEDYKRVIEYLREGKLSPGQIDARARRWAVKLFLAHLHHVMHVDFYGTEPPKPYAIAHLDHVHMIPPEHLDEFMEFKKIADSVNEQKQAKLAAAKARKAAIA